MIATSMALIVTGSWLMPSTHEPSHGAGQRRPVNSGKLLVACRRSIAARQRSRYTKSFQSGIRLPSGHPWWQKGMPQSMQRAPWSRSSDRAYGTYTSCQSSRRVSTGRVGGFLRWISMNPVALPIGLTQPRHQPRRHVRRWTSSDDSRLDASGNTVARGLDGARLRFCFRLRHQHALVIPRHDLDDPKLHAGEVVEQPLGVRTSRQHDMAREQVADELDVGSD